MNQSFFYCAMNCKLQFVISLYYFMRIWEKTTQVSEILWNFLSKFDEIYVSSVIWVEFRSTAPHWHLKTFPKETRNSLNWYAYKKGFMTAFKCNKITQISMAIQLSMQ